MKQYELIIEENQPKCGGRAPTKSTILEISTDDPVEYVKRAEGTNDVEVDVSEGNGTVVIRVQRSEYGYWVKYEFTEE